MKLKTTGLHMAGDGRLKVMVLGPSGIGKTRWASFWPKPIYADVEDGLISLSDRTVQYAPIKNSADMLEFLNFIKREANRPPSQWKYETVVIDTVDTYARKVKQEWIENNRASGFGGWDAWDFLESKMQQLFTRLLNLPLNVVVLAHVKPTTIVEGEGEHKTERIEYGLRLQGQAREWAPDDFDLIGRMGYYYKTEGDERVRTRGLTFKEGDPEWPIVKDRFNMTPPWMEVTFADTDYTNLFSLWTERMAEMESAGVQDRSDEVQEIDVPDEDAPDTADVVSDVQGGPVAQAPGTVPAGVPFSQLSRPDAIKLAKTVPALAPGVKGNTTKGEVVGWLEKHRKDHPEEWSADGVWIGAQTSLTDVEPEKEPESPKPTPEPEEAPEPEPAGQTEPEPEKEAPEEAPEPEPESEPEAVASPEPAADDDQQWNRDDPEVCSVDGCTPDLPGTPTPIVKLSRIRHRRSLCGTDEGCFQNCYEAAKAGDLPAGRGWGKTHWN